MTSSPAGGSCEVPQTQCEITGLSNGTTYTSTVAARNSNGFGVESAPSNEVNPLASVDPEPEPDPEPQVGVIELPARVKGARGSKARIILDVQSRAPFRELRMLARVKKKNVDLEARFKRTKRGDIRTIFTLDIRPGRHTLRLVQIVDGKRFVLDKARLVVTRR